MFQVGYSRYCTGPKFPLCIFLDNKAFQDITFLPQSIRKPANSSKTLPPLPILLDRTQWGFMLPWLYWLTPFGSHLQMQFHFVCVVSEPSHL